MNANTSFSPDVPADILEKRAAEQRRRIHESVQELRSKVKSTVEEKLDVQRQARKHLGPAAGAAVLVGLIFGYGVAGIFTRPPR